MEINQKYYTGLENFTTLDEQVVAEFLRQERDDRPHFLANKNWELLAGHELRYEKPKEYIEEAENICVTRKAQIKKYSSNFMIKWALGQTVIDGVNAFADKLSPVLLNRIHCEKNLYEAVLAGTKQVAEEENKDLMDLVKTEAGRNEVFKKLFPTKEAFNDYAKNMIVTSCNLLDEVYSALQTIEPQLPALMTKPIIGNIIKREWNTHRQNLPSKEISTAFFNEETRYTQERAEQIYKV